MKSPKVIPALVALMILSSVSAGAQKATLSRTALGFGNHPVGKTSTALNVILTNSDAKTALSIGSIVASGDYIESDDCGGSLAPASSCTVLVSFKPNITGVLTGSVTLTDDATNSPQFINLTGTGIQPISVSPSTLTFPTVTVGKTSAAQTLTVTSLLTSPVTLGFSSSANYSAVGSGTTPCSTTLGAKASCTIAVKFQPTTAGTIDGSLTVTQNASTVPQLVTFSGKGSGGGKAPLSLSPASMSFGSIGVGASYKRTAFVTNNSTSTVTISSIAGSGDFKVVGGSVSPCGGALPPSEQCSMDVTFTPTQTGTLTGAASITDNGSVKVQTLNLTGTGFAQAVVSPTSLVFATQQQGASSAPQTVTLTNQQKTTLNITSIAASGDYLTTNNCGSAVAAASSCTISVIFRPIARTGAVTGALTITTNAKSSPHVVELSGTSTGMLTRFAYVANHDSNTISQYTVDLGSGQLRSNGYVLSGNGPTSLAVAPSNKFLYVVNTDDNTVTPYSINAMNGRLSGLSPTATGGTPVSIAITPSSGFAYTANEDGTVSGYAVNSTAGVLTAIPGSPFSAGSIPRAIAVTAKFVYVTNLADGTVSAYQLNATSGTLTPVKGSPFSTGDFPSAVAVDPSASFAYVTNLGDNTVSAFSIDPSSGALTAVAGSPFAAAEGAISVTVDHSGRFVFVANENSSNISAYTITPSSGALTPVSGSPFATPGSTPFAVSVDITNQFLCVSDTSLDDVATFAINQESGALKLQKIAPTGPAPFSMAMSGGTTPTTYVPTFTYVSVIGASSVLGYTIEPESGNLTTVSGSPFAVPASGNNPWVNVDPFERFLYVTNYVPIGKVSAMALNPQTGTLTNIPGSPFNVANFPSAVYVDPSGRFAFVSGGGGAGLSVYSVNAATGALTLVFGPVASNYYGGAIAIDPSGRFLYQLNIANTTIFAFAINPSTGALTAVPGSPFNAGNGAASIAVDPSGRFTYVANFNDSTISAFIIDPATGALSPVKGSPFSTGTGKDPEGLTIDPSGRFVYTTNLVTTNISAYAISPTDGTLAEISASPFATGNEPYAVATDPSGRFLYEASLGPDGYNTGTISMYAIDAATGALTPLPNSPLQTGSQPYALAVTGVIH